VNPHHYRDGRVDVCERLEHPAVTGLGEFLTAVLGGHVEAAEAELSEASHDVVADPALLLDPAWVDLLERELAQRPVECPYPSLLIGIGLRVRKHDLLLNLTEKERLCEGRDSLERLGVLPGGGGFHPRGEPSTRRPSAVIVELIACRKAESGQAGARLSFVRSWERGGTSAISRPCGLRSTIRSFTSLPKR
jgi:hypothetical protein